MPDKATLEALSGLPVAIVAIVALALTIRAIVLQRRAVPDQAERLNDQIDERVLHHQANFVMFYRPVFEGLARGDAPREAAVTAALDRLEEEVRERARLTAERLYRR